MRAIIYARVSTEEQKLYGYSLDAQIDACKNYCERRGWKVVMIYKEAISSRKEDKRPQFQRAITFLKEGGADVLVAWKLDRISRSNFEFQKLLREVGYKFATVEDNLDLTDEHKKLEADIRIAFAEEKEYKLQNKVWAGQSHGRGEEDWQTSQILGGNSTEGSQTARVGILHERDFGEAGNIR